MKQITFVQSFLLFCVLLVGFLARTVNLNYNSPFSDEAIYVVVGRLGVFQDDWTTYNAKSWMGGLPYTYPTMTALSYAGGGILGSRLLNVLFNIFCVKIIYDIVIQYNRNRNIYDYKAGIIAAAVASMSSISLYVARLATYDMPSFFFLFLSILFILKAEHKDFNKGKNYFLAGIFLLFAFFIKIVAMFYIPLIIAYSLYVAWKLRKTHMNFWIIYFVAVLAIGALWYLITMIPSFTSFVNNQAFTERDSITDVLLYYWDHTRLVIYLAILGVLGLLAKKQYKTLGLLIIGALWILIVHALSHRNRTFDKHMFISVGFLSMIAGIGISGIIDLIKTQTYKNFAYMTVGVILVAYSYFSYLDLDRFNHMWPNTDNMLSFMKTEVKSGDKVLSESGASTILALYDKNYPFNITTFDFFEYGDDSNDNTKAYSRAVRDGYFNYIELHDFSSQNNIRERVAENLSGSYKNIYSKDGFNIYKRTF
ncbi:MAG: glycosyltransferase family 39 protein [bacterium]|nr:glycosyltransferase family 39 protein [bacterium]